MKRQNKTRAKIRLAPNSILSTICVPVEDGEDVSHIIRDMMYILTNSKTGVGLAANQAGYDKRIIIISQAGFFTTMINPEFEPFDGKKETGQEGCLSYPGKFKKIARFTCIDVVYTNAKGFSDCNTFRGWIARIIQHEIDHLDGKCKVGEISN